MKQNSQNQTSFKPTFFQKFFWFCSGVDVDLLVGNYSEFPKPLKAEFNKYIGVGTAVFFTAVFASISASFALSFMEGSKWWTCMIFGVIWGINIFFLDRYIVATMRKEDSKLREILYAMPRILIGLVFAFTISVPIELSLFGGKIQDELSIYNTGRVSNCEKECNDKITNLSKQISELDNQIKVKQSEQPQGYQELLSQQKGIQGQINQISSEISRNETVIYNNRTSNANYPDISDERYILNETAKRYQYLNRIKSNEMSSQRNQLAKVNAEIQEKFKKFQEELDRLTVQVEQQKEPLKQEIVRQTTDCPKYIVECQRVAKGNVDLLSRYDALGRAKGSWFSSIWWASFVIQLLFIFLELAPVLSKIIASKGSYDERIESIESQEKLSASEKNNEINERLLDVQNENAKSQEIRNVSLEEAKQKAATLIYEIQQKENLVQSNVEEDINLKRKEQELLAILKSQEISEQLEEAKATYNISLDTIAKGEAAEKALQKKVADYISNKQFEQLKKEIDDFFETPKEVEKKGKK
jgi:hypothetical protein